MGGGGWSTCRWTRTCCAGALAERAQRFDADAAFPITDEVLTGFLSGFEVPRGEGEEVVTPHP